MEAATRSAVLKSTEDVKPSPKLMILEGLGGRYRLVPVFVALIVIWIVFASLHENFLSARNLTNLSIQIVNTAVIAIGLLFVLVLGEIDLSVASLGAVSAAISATFSVLMGWPLALALAVGIAFGIAFGVLHGLIVTRFGAPAFIVTLGGQLALNGLLLLILPKENMISLVGQEMSVITTMYIPLIASIGVVLITAAVVFALSHQSFAQAKNNAVAVNYSRSVLVPAALVAVVGAVVVLLFNQYKGLNLSVVILFALMGICHYVFTQTKFGTYLFAIGGNAEAARRAGINVKMIKLAAFMISSAIIAIGGIISASRVQGVSAASGDPDILMNGIAAAVLGGASLMGGRGSVWGILVGALVIGSISNGMFLIGADTSLRLIIQGVILVLAIVLDSVIVKSTSTRG